MISFAFVRIKISSYPSQNVTNKYPFSLTNLFPLAVSFTSVSLVICSLFSDEMDTFDEYSDLVYSLATNLINIVIFVTIFVKRADIFEFIDMFEEEFTKRKFKIHDESMFELLTESSIFGIKI